MAMIPAILVFGVMVWFATRAEDGTQRVDPQAGMPDFTVDEAYSIEGFEYAVYEIKRPDGEAYEWREGIDDKFFIGTSNDLSTVLENASGYATYNTLAQARSALDSMWDAQNDPNAPVGPTGGRAEATHESTTTIDEEGLKRVSSKPKKADLAKEQKGVIVAEGREEGAMLEELDVEIYDGGQMVESYTIEGATVQTGNTDLGGSL